MSTYRRPRNHDQRRQAHQVVDRYVAQKAPDPEPDPSVVALVHRLFTAPKEAYVVAMDAKHKARIEARAASDRADAADRVFDRAFRRVIRDLTDDEVKGVASDLRPLLGGYAPSEVVDLPHDQETAIAREFLTSIAKLSRFHADPAHVAELMAAIPPLELAAGEDAAADRAFDEASRRARQARKAFDAAYGKLRKAVEAIVDEATLLRIFPVFVGRDEDDGES